VALLDALDKELATLDVTAAQYIVIALLANGTAVSPSELCKVISYDPGAMTRMLDRLEAKRLIRRVRTNGDRRTVNLELLADGKALYPEMRVAVVAHSGVSRYISTA
jgi:DNA-binding MarR family transcriptional regulator